MEPNGISGSFLVSSSLIDKRKYRCPKHGIVTTHIQVTLTPLPRYHCLACYADWLEANIPQLEEVDQEEKK